MPDDKQSQRRKEEIVVRVCIAVMFVAYVALIIVAVAQRGCHR